MKQVSIKLRLTLTALILNALVLGILFFVAIAWYRAESYRNLDAHLEASAAAYVEAIRGFLAAELHGVESRRLPKEIDRALDLPEFDTALESAADIHFNTPQIVKTTTSVFNASGERLFTSNNALPVELPSPESMKALGQSRRHAESAIRTVEDGPDLRYRVVSIPIYYRDQAVALVQESALTAAVDGPLDDLYYLCLIGLPLILILSAGLFFAILHRAFKPVNDIVATIHRITGSNLQVRVPLPASDDEIRLLATTFNEMLDRVDASFQFQASLAQDLSHQLRTPLSILKGSLETALRHSRSAEEYERIMESDLEEVDRLVRLIESILLLARLDSRSAPLELESVDPGNLIRELCLDLAPLWDQKKLRLSLEMDSPATISADAARLRQVFLNLLDNAWKFSPEGGAIAISIGESPSEVAVSIRNDGPGIPPDRIEHIFQRFYRAPLAGTQPTGFGLGLPIARTIVELHGGTLTAASPSGGGAVFTVRLPKANRR